MKIETNDYLTIGEAAEAIGASPRGISRAINRAGRDEVTAVFWGHMVVKRSMLSEIKKHYFQRGTKRASIAAKHFGHLGGSQKAANARKRAAGSGRGGRAASS